MDLQVNGYAGFDFNSAPAAWSSEALHRVRSAMRRRGVAVALPTFITDDPARLVARARRYSALLEREPELERSFPRLHVEGPFLSPEDGPRGAHPREHCRVPRELPDLLDRLQDASGGRLGILTLAPELPGSPELIARASAAGVCVALGHTRASPEALSAAVTAGARMSTHLGNGSDQLLPRLANYVQAQLAEDALHASFIADGHHIPWYTLRNFIRAKTPALSVLVTDAVAAADAPPGRYRLGEAEVVASVEGWVRRPGQENLAGSALTLDRAVVSVALHCGVPFEEAWAMASTRPAALLGLDPPEEVAVQVTADGFRALTGVG